MLWRNPLLCFYVCILQSSRENVNVSVCVYACVLATSQTYPLSRIPAFIGNNKADVSVYSGSVPRAPKATTRLRTNVKIKQLLW